MDWALVMNIALGIVGGVILLVLLPIIVTAVLNVLNRYVLLLILIVAFLYGVTIKNEFALFVASLGAVAIFIYYIYRAIKGVGHWYEAKRNKKHS